MFLVTPGTTHPCSERGVLPCVCRSVGQVVDGRMALGAVVGEVELAGGPEESELALRFSAAEPVEVHVHGFCFTRNDGLVGYADRCGIVSLDGSGGLRPSHFGEGLPEGDHLFCDEEEAAEFCFGC